MATDSPGVDLYALGRDEIRWTSKLPGMATYLRWFGDELVAGTDSGYLAVYGADGGKKFSQKLKGEVYKVVPWPSGLAVVTRWVGPEGEVSMIYPPSVEVKGYVLHLSWVKDGPLVAYSNGSTLTLAFFGSNQWKKSWSGAKFLAAGKGVAIGLNGKVILLNLDGKELEALSFQAEGGCWGDKLYIYGPSGLYAYDGSLKRVLQAEVVELSCNPLVAVLRDGKGWKIYFKGKLFDVPGRPYNIQVYRDRLAFTYREGVGFIDEQLKLMEGDFAGWAGDSPIVYREGLLCRP